MNYTLAYGWWGISNHVFSPKILDKKSLLERLGYISPKQTDFHTTIT